ncbi:MAG: anti-sigma factor antagonist [Chitinophagaceae bacterium]|jgi:anti-sigma B factor antagonist|nr:MAG: anti-sigma factor antagonist [Chitinophagaceae bacterium]
MKYTIEKNEKYTMFRLDDDKLNNINAPKLKSELVILNAGGVKNIILDMKDVSFVDSSGLSAILIGNRLCKNANGTFVVTNLTEYVHKLVKISQLDSILSIIPSNEEAVEYVMMEELERDLKKDNE